MGFSRGALLASFVAESVGLSLFGYIGGVVLGSGALVLINSLMQGVALQLPSSSTVVVHLRLSPLSLLVTFGLALLMGVVGGFFPARRAARLSVLEALRRR
jgi:putative ABC transport system permease protein